MSEKRIKSAAKPRRRRDSSQLPPITSEVNFGYVLFIIIGGIILAVIVEARNENREIWTALAGLMYWVVLIALGIACAIMGVVLWIMVKRNYRFMDENNDGLALLHSGRLDDAAAQFEKLMERNNGNWIAKNNLAAVSIRQRRFGVALKLLDECTKQKEYPKKLYPIAINLADLHALSSDLTVACEAFDAASKRVSDARYGHLAFSRALIAIRSGDFLAAADMSEEEWFAAEAGGGRHMRILRAFALSKIPPTEQSHALMQQMLAGARPFRSGEYDFLATRIPELKTFLIEHGFSQPQAAPGA